MPERSAPASAANSAPSPVLVLVPRAPLRKAQPPVARTTAPARTRYGSWAWRRYPAAPATAPSASVSSSVTGLWSRMRTPARRTRMRIRRMYSGPWRPPRSGCPSGPVGKG